MKLFTTAKEKVLNHRGVPADVQWLKLLGIKIYALESTPLSKSDAHKLIDEKVAALRIEMQTNLEKYRKNIADIEILVKKTDHPLIKEVVEKVKSNLAKYEKQYEDFNKKFPL